jgi:SAM-dependent methyltransferase
VRVVNQWSAVGTVAYGPDCLATTWDMPAGSGDQWPVDYERGRPGWPREALDVHGLPRSATVLDLGAGTGKLTRLLVSRFDHVIAVEPADAMRRVLSKQCPQADARRGHARGIPLVDASVDAIFAAETFHWFDDDVALTEMARVLREGGALVLMWNLPAGPWEPSVAEAEALLRERLPEAVEHDPVDLGGPRRGDGNWSCSFAAAGFGRLTETRVANPQKLDRDGLVAFFASLGWIADLPDGDRHLLLDEVRALLTEGEYRRLWTTEVYATRLGVG